MVHTMVASHKIIFAQCGSQQHLIHFYYAATSHSQRCSHVPPSASASPSPRHGAVLGFIAFDAELGHPYQYVRSRCFRRAWITGSPFFSTKKQGKGPNNPN